MVRIVYIRYTQHCIVYFFCFFFNDTATTEIYTLSLHDALPIYYKSLYQNVRFNLCRLNCFSYDLEMIDYDFRIKVEGYKDYSKKIKELRKNWFNNPDLDSYSYLIEKQLDLMLMSISLIDEYIKDNDVLLVSPNKNFKILDRKSVV